MRRGMSKEMAEVVRNRMNDLNLNRPRMAAALSLSLQGFNELMQGRRTLTPEHTQAISQTLKIEREKLKTIQEVTTWTQKSEQ